MKVVHVVASLRAGGIEKWLSDYVKYNASLSSPLELSFVVQDPKHGFFEEDIREAGCHVRRCELSKGLLLYIVDLFNALRFEKPDVIHSHVHHFSGIVCLVAWVAGVKVRVAHSHNEHKMKGVKWFSDLYYFLMKKLVRWFSNRKIAVSDLASKSLFVDDRSVTILPCGLLLPKVVRRRVRQDRQVVLAHVGSFTSQKNHAFMISVVEYLERLQPGVFKLNLIGDGELRLSVEHLINEKSLGEAVKLLGLRSDVVNILSEQSDIFILPSLHEGLSLACVEAQSAGLPMVLSDTLSRMHQLTDLVSFASIEAPEYFAKAILNVVDRLDEFDTGRAQEAIRESVLSISQNSEIIKSVYLDSRYRYLWSGE